ncbi:MAG: altronate dehydratase [Hyphomonadaceae bacterium]|nr:altronate dehydratase [Clostridia bacterium]
MNSEKLIKIAEGDNVAVVLLPVQKGESIKLEGVAFDVQDDITSGQKIAIANIASGADVVKYGCPIGYATQDILTGQWVHTHNVKTKLNDKATYTYDKQPISEFACTPKSFMGYKRANGKVGIRNEIWIVNTVGCVNKTSEILAQRANALNTGKTDGIFAYTHPYGCSQLGDDHLNTQKILCGLINHPNAGGVLVLGLGCENNNMDALKKVLGDYNPDRVKFLSTQDIADEIQTGLALIEELEQYATQAKREVCDSNALIIGLKCGGSDGFSGITANPLVGRISDMHIACGGTSLLTEVPEMFGAEQILMNRCVNADVFDKTVDMINDFKQYYIAHNQPVYENPSPGNKQGGITTLEDKSLGCTQKGGNGEVVDVLKYGERVSKNGLNLLEGPGNDIVATTALTAAGAHIILFTTGRGTPLGAPVPTVKVSTNTALSEKKSNWIDFDAGCLLTGQTMDSLGKAFYEYILTVASGTSTKNETNGYREIAIFKNGVTL